MVQTRTAYTCLVGAVVFDRVVDMAHKLTKQTDSFHVSKFGLELDVYGDFESFNISKGSVEDGHNQEFYHKESTFHYFILEGSATFYLDEEPVEVEVGDMLSIEPNTRIYYKGSIKFFEISTPPWTEEGEVETRPKIW